MSARCIPGRQICAHGVYPNACTICLNAEIEVTRIQLKYALHHGRILLRWIDGNHPGNSSTFIREAREVLEES